MVLRSYLFLVRRETEQTGDRGSTIKYDHLHTMGKYHFDTLQEVVQVIDRRPWRAAHRDPPGATAEKIFFYQEQTGALAGGIVMNGGRETFIQLLLQPLHRCLFL